MPALTSVIKDAAYVGLGLGVMTFQKAQVRRREVRREVDARLADARDGLDRLSDTVEDRVKVVEERLEGLQEQLEGTIGTVEEQLDKVLDDVQARLAGQAADAVRTARQAARGASDQLRSRLRPVA